VTRVTLDTEVTFNDRRTVVIYELVGPQLTCWPGTYGLYHN